MGEGIRERCESLGLGFSQICTQMTASYVPTVVMMVKKNQEVPSTLSRQTAPPDASRAACSKTISLSASVAFSGSNASYKSCCTRCHSSKYVCACRSGRDALINLSEGKNMKSVDPHSSLIASLQQRIQLKDKEEDADGSCS